MRVCFFIYRIKRQKINGRRKIDAIDGTFTLITETAQNSFEIALITTKQSLELEYICVHLIKSYFCLSILVRNFQI